MEGNNITYFFCSKDISSYIGNQYFGSILYLSNKYLICNISIAVRNVHKIVVYFESDLLIIIFQPTNIFQFGKYHEEGHILSELLELRSRTLDLQKRANYLWSSSSGSWWLQNIIQFHLILINDKQVPITLPADCISHG